MDQSASKPRKRSRYSTSTVLVEPGTGHRELGCPTPDKVTIVPWLAAKGPLAYSPEAPPDRDYFFQYSWILPDIFDPRVNLREHRYFGASRRDDGELLFSFWARARQGDVQQQYRQDGLISDIEIRAPLAAYYHTYWLRNEPGSLLIQHGSYQWTASEHQPGIPRGEVVLHRGIGRNDVFRALRFDPKKLSLANQEVWRKYLRVQARMLCDSILSFNTVHDRIKRCETGELRHDSWLGDDLAADERLDIGSSGFARDLWSMGQQSYSRILA